MEHPLGYHDICSAKFNFKQSEEVHDSGLVPVVFLFDFASIH